MENGMQVNIIKVLVSYYFLSAVTSVEVWL